MDLCEFIIELDIWYYLGPKNMILFTTKYKSKKWYHIFSHYFAKIKVESYNSLL